MLFDREGYLQVVEGAGEIAVAIEANDVEADEYVALDADGRALGLSVRYEAGRPKWWSTQEIEVATSSDRVERDDLRALLAEALGATAEGAALEDLLRAAQQGGRLSLQAPRTAAVLRERLGRL